MLSEPVIMLNQYSATVGARIVTAAARFLGLTEVRRNNVWEDLSQDGSAVLLAELEGELRRVGWHSDWPHCTAFVEACWRIGYQGRPELGDVRAMLDPSPLQSFRAAAERRWTSLTPSIGAIGVMRRGDSASGHAFIVRGVSNDNTTIYTLETDSVAAVSSDVYAMRRPYAVRPTTGLHLVGFITPFIFT